MHCMAGRITHLNVCKTIVQSKVVEVAEGAMRDEAADARPQHTRAVPLRHAAPLVALPAGTNGVKSAVCTLPKLPLGAATPLAVQHLVQLLNRVARLGGRPCQVVLLALCICHRLRSYSPQEVRGHLPSTH
jgi:hypothetical protein